MLIEIKPDTYIEAGAVVMIKAAGVHYVEGKDIHYSSVILRNSFVVDGVQGTPSEVAAMIEKARRS